ncbi:MAG: hypothetical protein IKO40_11525 [Kiritimatiellae bacterium]|nr:hypothetical protein [Kiritimatiellia bacterium]
MEKNAMLGIQRRQRTALVLALFAIAALMPRFAIARDYNVRDYGAKGDGETMDTTALQRTIDACAADGGGRVVLEEGSFLTGTLFLKTGVDLHIDASATLLGSTNCADYVEASDIKSVNPRRVARGRATCLVFADTAERIAISGRGTIDCNGQAFVRERENLTPWLAEHCRNERIPGLLSPPRVVFLAGCRNVMVADITVVNQPSGWCFWINDCDTVLFDRVKIFGGMHNPNNDGIHINCCRDVLVSNCHIETQDDCIVVRADYSMLPEKKDCERVSFMNCSLRSNCSCIRVSFMNDGVVRGCAFSNIFMHDSQNGLNLELCPKEEWLRDKNRRIEKATPSTVEDIVFSNIDMRRVDCPLRCVTGARPEIECVGIRDIRFENCHCREAVRHVFKGGEGNPLERFVFTNCTLPTEQPVSFENCLDFSFDKKTFTVVENL